METSLVGHGVSQQVLLWLHVMSGIALAAGQVLVWLHVKSCLGCMSWLTSLDLVRGCLASLVMAGIALVAGQVLVWLLVLSSCLLAANCNIHFCLYSYIQPKRVAMKPGIRHNTLKEVLAAAALVHNAHSRDNDPFG
jgi:hypothetical protein